MSPGGQILNWCKWCHLVDKFPTMQVPEIRIVKEMKIVKEVDIVKVVKIVKVKIVKEVKIVREVNKVKKVKRCDSSWCFACGDVLLLCTPWRGFPKGSISVSGKNHIWQNKIRCLNTLDLISLDFWWTRLRHKIIRLLFLFFSSSFCSSLNPQWLALLQMWCGTSPHCLFDLPHYFLSENLSNTQNEIVLN